MAKRTPRPRWRPRQRTLAQRALSLMVALLASSIARAQLDSSPDDVDTPGLRIEAVAGWSGAVDASRPVPLSFLIHNETERNLEGILALSDPISGQTVSLGDVFVSPQSARRLTSIQALVNWYNLDAKFVSRGQVLWRRELEVTFTRCDSRFSNVLYVDKAGGKLRFLDSPGSAASTTTGSNIQTLTAGIAGRPIQCLSAKPGHIPNHPGPLVSLQAIVFPDGATEKDLNQVQLRAIGEWMCQGGTVFVHKDSPGLIRQLVESAPLLPDFATTTGPFEVRRLGLGALYEYATSLHHADKSALRQELADTIARLDRNQINTFCDSGRLNLARGGRADQNRLMVVSFFAIYALLGVFAIFLSRQSQKRIAVYTSCIVLGASVMSAMLGGYLRNSRGDVSWVTVTQAGVGGLVQVGTIEIQSAGSRNTRVAVQGERADLQFINTPNDRYTYYHDHLIPRLTGYSPFTWQRNIATDRDDVYQVNVPMTLWGRRRCHATAFQRATPRIDFELGYEPSESERLAAGTPAALQATPDGEMSIKLVNRLPLDLNSVWLVVGISRAAPPTASPAAQSQPQSFAPASQQNSVDGRIDSYHVQQIASLASGGTLELKFPAHFQVRQYNWQMAGHWPSGSWIPPSLSRMGTVNAWIIARLPESPILSIDEDLSDFVPHASVHHFVQEILPEEIPDTLKPPEPLQ